MQSLARFRYRIAALLLITFAAVLSIDENKGWAAEKGRTPNIVLIMADDLGYGDIGCYGSKTIRTPNLDRLAADGVRFTDFHSSGTVCSPTRTGLLTGRYQQRAGIPGVIYADPKQNRHHGLQAEEITFAELLKEAGYATGCFGKWHLGYEKQFNPTHQGFDSFRGYVSGNIDYISHYDRMEIYDWWDGLKTIQEPGYSTHLITKHAIQFIERNKDRPFCLYIAHESPHSPYQGPGDPPQRGPKKVKQTLGPKRIQRAYREMVEEMDRGVGNVMAALEKHGLEENTLVFFLSDNGANRSGSNGSLRGFKGSVWEGGHRVPAIGYWPRHIDAGRICNEPTISIDLLPTMLDLTGVARPQGRKLDGVSLRPVLVDDNELKPRKLFWEYRNQAAVRDGTWKLVSHPMQKELVLYDLSKDLGEQKNLSKTHPQQVAKMKAALAAWQKDVANGATKQPEK